LAAWPRSAQWATAFLLGVTVALLAVNGWGYWRWGSRPAELDRAPAVNYRVNLNRADRAELLQLPGVGDSLAGRIEDYRRERGKIGSVNELIEIHGVGPATLDRLRPWVEADEPADAAAEVPSAVKTRKKTSASKSVIGAKKAASLTEPIDVNRASLEELQRLPGVGPKMSQRIADERSKAPFQSVDDLRRVSGIGPKTLERLKPYITISPSPIREAGQTKRDGSVVRTQ
jgi:competence protein ComEA